MRYLCIVILVLSFIGCGGGGSETPTEVKIGEPEPPTIIEPDPVEPLISYDVNVIDEWNWFTEYQPYGFAQMSFAIYNDNQPISGIDMIYEFYADNKQVTGESFVEHVPDKTLIFLDVNDYSNKYPNYKSEMTDALNEVMDHLFAIEEDNSRKVFLYTQGNIQELDDEFEFYEDMFTRGFFTTYDKVKETIEKYEVDRAIMVTGTGLVIKADETPEINVPVHIAHLYNIIQNHPVEIESQENVKMLAENTGGVYVDITDLTSYDSLAVELNKAINSTYQVVFIPSEPAYDFSFHLYLEDDDNGVHIFDGTVEVTEPTSTN